MTGRVDEDWLEGSLQGQKGIFPANFIDNVAQYKGVWHSIMGCGVV